MSTLLMLREEYLIDDVGVKGGGVRALAGLRP